MKWKFPKFRSSSKLEESRSGNDEDLSISNVSQSFSDGKDEPITGESFNSDLDDTSANNIMSTEPSATQGEKIIYAQDRQGQTATSEQNQNNYAEKDLQIKECRLEYTGYMLDSNYNSPNQSTVLEDTEIDPDLFGTRQSETVPSYMNSTANNEYNINQSQENNPERSVDGEKSELFETVNDDNSIQLSYDNAASCINTLKNDNKCEKYLKPDYSSIVVDAIKCLKEKNGSSLQSIKRFIARRYQIDVDKENTFIRDALRRNVKKKRIEQVVEPLCILYKVTKHKKRLPMIKIKRKKTAKIKRKVPMTSTPFHQKSCKRLGESFDDSERAVKRIKSMLQRDYQNSAVGAPVVGSSHAISVSTQSSIQDHSACPNSRMEERTCWVCYATNEDDPDASWSSPCRCSGTSKWVHTSCLHTWITEKQKGNPSVEVKCSQCATPYIINYPKANTFILLLDLAETIGRIGFPLMCIGCSIVGVYWCGVTFGALTMIQVYGYKQGMAILKRTHPAILGISLPFIPASLLVGKMFQWEGLVLKALRKVVPKVPLSRYILPIFHPSNQNGTFSEQPAAIPPENHYISKSRTLCGALFFPTLSSLFGSIFYRKVESDLHRAMLGAATFVLGKGAIKIYHKQYNFFRQSQREIVDFESSNNGQ